MEASTTIRKMMAGNEIAVPSYQRAYSWDSPSEGTNRNTQTDVFLSDLEEYRKSNPKSPYYFGHFLFEKRNQKFYVIDGQQRLTTIVIFLSALFARLKEIRDLSEDGEILFEDMIKRRSVRRFITVDYDDQLFKDYVIEQSRADHHGLETESARRIVRAFDFFKKQLAGSSDTYLEDLLSIISQSACTTHLVQNESEATQMFIFQNNRGKHPSNLEIVKAQFMYNVHLYGSNGSEALVDEIKNRFEKIYKSISKIEYRINEDDILLYTLRVHFNSLWEPETTALDKINKELSEETQLDFIESFSRSLEMSFDHLSCFFCKDEGEDFAIHSLITLGGITIALPFVIKAYRYGLPINEIKTLCSSMENLVLRHRLIGTRANIESRIDDVFKNFSGNNKDICPIVTRIEKLKKVPESEWWWAYWNDEKLEKSLQGGIDHTIAKYLLWKYENYLKGQGAKGYSPSRFDFIENPQLEHIAPITEPEKKPHGYDEYDEEFKNQYLNCLGNYLLLSESQNCAIGNIPFAEKLITYTNNEQQREIKTLAPNEMWTKEIIQKRKEKIINFIMKNC